MKAAKRTVRYMTCQICGKRIRTNFTPEERLQYIFSHNIITHSSVGKECPQEGK